MVPPSMSCCTTESTVLAAEFISPNLTVAKAFKSARPNVSKLSGVLFKITAALYTAGVKQATMKLIVAPLATSTESFSRSSLAVNRTAFRMNKSATTTFGKVSTEQTSTLCNTSLTLAMSMVPRSWFPSWSGGWPRCCPCPSSPCPRWP